MGNHLTKQQENKMKIIDSREIERDYGFIGNEVIIDHPEYGRILVLDGFGGIDTPSGGAVRWRHGSVYHLKADDTFSNLDVEDSNYNSLLTLIKNCCDQERPYLDLEGYHIETLMKSIDLSK